MKKRFFIFLVALLVWSLLNWPPQGVYLLFGIFVAGFVAYLSGDLFYRNELFFNGKRIFYFLFQFLPLFFMSYLAASFNMVYRVLHPGLLIHPGIVKVKTQIKSDTGLAFLANSLTLATGTITVDLDKEKGFLYLHWVDIKTQDTEEIAKRIAGRFEPVLKKIFD